jgi:hypothetical protein
MQSTQARRMPTASGGFEMCLTIEKGPNDVSRDLFEQGWNGTDKLLQVEPIRFDGSDRS